MARSSASAMARAASTPPRMFWALKVKQSTTVSGISTVQMPEVSLTPVRLSMST